MTTSAETTLDAWFVHPKLALALLDHTARQHIVAGLPPVEHPMWRSYHANAMEQAIAAAFVRLNPTSLITAHLQSTLKEGQLVWAEQHFFYNGVTKAVSEVEAGRLGRGRFHSSLPIDRKIKVTGEFNVEHLTSSTSVNELSGQGNHFILGYVNSFSAEAVEMRPILIANRWQAVSGQIPATIVEREEPHVWPSQIDQFEGVDWALPLKPRDLNALRTISEQRVKEWLAEIIGEPSLPKDWGGEQFDLWTDRISLKGKQVRTAFALKGPAKFHPMTVADLGKNGDQISRLATTVADLLVVQHCHTITAPIHHTLRAFAVDPANPRRYMTIDGYQTIRIFRHFNYM